jgi:hypothetical protein
MALNVPSSFYYQSHDIFGFPADGAVTEINVNAVL